MYPTQINYKVGNLLTGCYAFDAIAHGVNCQGKMGAGIAKSIKTLFPMVFRQYHKVCKMNGPNTLMGSAQPVSVGDRGFTVWNLFTQVSYGKGQQISYTALNDAFEMMFKDYRYADKVNIGIPKIGAGLGGGDWNIISEILEALLRKYPNINLTVFELKE